MSDLREAAQAALDALDDFDKQCTAQSIFVPAEIDTVFDKLRAALAQPEDAMTRFSRINQEMDGLLHDKAHVDTGKTRAAQSVRTPEMSYRPGSLPMDADINRLCAVMLKHGLATGHGDTMAQVIAELEIGLTELRRSLAVRSRL